jgi:hypothetical protein
MAICLRYFNQDDVFKTCSSEIQIILVMSQLTWSVASSVQVRTVLGKVALEQNFFQKIWLPIETILPMLHLHMPSSVSGTLQFAGAGNCLYQLFNIIHHVCLGIQNDPFSSGFSV